ncbi:MAG: thioesterase family protein [Gammaproteobacteria bacterium]|nr:thioesterase family protein [Gammaproteobacteria bacterium]
MTTLKLHKEPLQDTWLDAYGHLNEAYYLVPFTNTSWKFQDHFGIGVDYFEETGCALYTLETHLRYVAEVRAPALIEVETILLGSDEKRIWFAHQMIVDGKLCATGEFMGLHYSTRDSRTAAMPESVQSALRQAEVDEKPDWVGRQISLVKK